VQARKLFCSITNMRKNYEKLEVSGNRMS
jgi:hypothetical protein